MNLGREVADVALETALLREVEPRFKQGVVLKFEVAPIEDSCANTEFEETRILEFEVEYRKEDGATDLNMIWKRWTAPVWVGLTRDNFQRTEVSEIVHAVRDTIRWCCEWLRLFLYIKNCVDFDYVRIDVKNGKAHAGKKKKDTSIN